MQLHKIVFLTTILAGAFVFLPLFAAQTSSKIKPVRETTASEIVAKNTSPIAPIHEKEAPNKDKSKVYHVYDDINLASKIDFQYAKPKIMIKIVTPFLSSDANDENNVQFFNQAVMDIVNEEIQTFKQKVAGFADSQNKMPRKNISNRLTIDFDTAAIDSGKNHIVSIRFSLQGYITGMAHPYHYHRVLNFDLDNNRMLEMSDLFKADRDYISVLAKLANVSLSRRLENKEMVSEGTAPIPENFKNWNIKPYGLLITFDEAQVAPYVNGAQTILIPYSKLKDIISPQSPIAACLKHRRRCLSDNLLTGGFIDEA